MCEEWEIYVRDQCICTYCGFDGRMSPVAWYQTTIDHVIPLRCGQHERKKSPLNVRENKVVACLSCNNIKRSWDRSYNESRFPGSTMEARVEKAHEDAKAHILKFYRERWDIDYEPMMKEISERGENTTSAA